MAAAAQLEGRYGLDSSRKCPPTRLTRGIRLTRAQATHQFAWSEPREHRPAARLPRRKVHDCDQFERPRSEAEAALPQVDLEFLDTAAAADRWRAAQRRRIPRRQEAQRVVAHMQKVGDPGCEQTLRRHEQAV